MYADALSEGLADVLSDAMMVQKEKAEFWKQTKVTGLENALANEVALECLWKTEKIWAFKKPSHINIQESVAVLKLAEHLAQRKKSLRVVSLVDSNVVRCALSKGGPPREDLLR